MDCYGGDICPALEKDTIDGAEWVGPNDDEKLGFYKIVKHFHYPGWWESNSMHSFFINSKEWEKLPKQYQAAFEAAAYEAKLDMMASHDFKNPFALRSLVGKGVQLRSVSSEIMKAAQTAACGLFEEEADENPAFKKLSVRRLKFRADINLWHRVAEQPYSAFAVANPPPTKK